MAGAVADQRRPRRRVRRRSVATLAAPVRREIADSVGRQIGAREDGEDSAGGAGRRRIDRADGGVRVRRTHHDGVRLMGQAHIVGVAPEPLEQARILDAAHRLPDTEFFDGHRIGHDAAGVYAR